MSNYTSNKDPQFAQTLANGIDILAAFYEEKYSLGNKELAERTGLAPSTVARLTFTLTEYGYLKRTSNRQYTLGPAILTIGHPLLASLHIRQQSRSLMNNLANSIQGAVSLVMFDRHHMVYVETARANPNMPSQPDIGYRLPMLTTAAGRAWLAKVDTNTRSSTLNQIKIFDPDYFQQHISSLDDARQHFYQYGYCTNNKEWRPDVYGFAAPMSKPISSNILIFNCGVPASDGTFSKRCNEIGKQLLALIYGVENALSY